MEMFSVEILVNDFCIPLDLLGIKDLKKIEKGQRNFWKPN